MYSIYPRSMSSTLRNRLTSPKNVLDIMLVVLGAQTVVERIDHRSKVQLMKHFIWGVTAYVLATAAVITVPLFLAPADPQVGTSFWNLKACFSLTMQSASRILQVNQRAG